MQTKQLHYHRFPETEIRATEAVALDHIHQILVKRTQPTRDEVAVVIRLCALIAYIGGRHVAIHHSHPEGNIEGAPIAMFTGNYGEWL